MVRTWMGFRLAQRLQLSVHESSTPIATAPLRRSQRTRRYGANVPDAATWLASIVVRAAGRRGAGAPAVRGELVHHEDGDVMAKRILLPVERTTEMEFALRVTRMIALESGGVEIGRASCRERV